MKLYPLALTLVPYFPVGPSYNSYLARTTIFPLPGIVACCVLRRLLNRRFIHTACPSDCDRRIRRQFWENHEGERRRAATRRRFAVQFRWFSRISTHTHTSFIFPQNIRYSCRFVFLTEWRHAWSGVCTIALTAAKNKYEQN